MEVIEDVDKVIGFFEIVTKFVEGLSTDKILSDLGPKLTLSCTLSMLARATDAGIGVER